MAIPVLPLATMSAACDDPCCPKWLVDCCPYSCGLPSLMTIHTSHGDGIIEYGAFASATWSGSLPVSGSMHLILTYSLFCSDTGWKMYIHIGDEVTFAIEQSIVSGCRGDIAEFLFTDLEVFGLEDITVVVSESGNNPCGCCCFGSGQVRIVRPLDFSDGSCYDCSENVINDPVLSGAEEILLTSPMFPQSPGCPLVSGTIEFIPQIERLGGNTCVCPEYDPLDEIAGPVGASFLLYYKKEDGKCKAILSMAIRDEKCMPTTGSFVPGLELARWEKLLDTCVRYTTTLDLVFNSGLCEPPETITLEPL